MGCGATFFEKTFQSIGGCGGRHYEQNVSSPKRRKGDTNIRAKIGTFENLQQSPVIVEEFATDGTVESVSLLRAQGGFCHRAMPDQRLVQKNFPGVAPEI